MTILVPVLFGLIASAWLASGVTLVMAPSWWLAAARRAMADPLPRMAWSYGVMLSGLILLLGSSGLRGAWVWMGVGAISVGKALVWLGLSDTARQAWLDRWLRLPPWACRLVGTTAVIFATLLAVDMAGALR